MTDDNHSLSELDYEMGEETDDDPARAAGNNTDSCRSMMALLLKAMDRQTAAILSTVTNQQSVASIGVGPVASVGDGRVPVTGVGVDQVLGASVGDGYTPVASPGGRCTPVASMCEVRTQVATGGQVAVASMCEVRTQMAAGGQASVASGGDGRHSMSSADVLGDTPLTAGVKVRRGDSSLASPCTGECSGAVGRQHRDVRVGGEILEAFDPDDPEANVDRWIAKIDQLGAIHGWSAYERAYFAQIKLKGAAKRWFNHLDDYGRSWESWKVELRKAFPRRDDYAVRLEELVARRKLPGETMAAYYHDKVAMLGRCRITGEDAVSVVIRGLPVDLRAGAHAARCSTPSDLYTNFLAGVNTYSAALVASEAKAFSSAEVPRRKQGDTSGQREKRRLVGVTKRPSTQAVCYNCQEVGGHYSRDCPKPKMDRCKLCKLGGHWAKDCPKARKGEPRRVSLIQTSLGQHKKMALANDGEKVKVYLDTGAECSLITTDCARRLGVSIKPNEMVLKGFGGYTTMALGEVAFDLTIDGVVLQITALVTSCELAGADVFLGQPVWASQGVTLVMREGRATLHKGEAIEEVFRNLTLATKDDDDDEQPTQREVRVAVADTIQPGESKSILVKAERCGANEMLLFEEKTFPENGAHLIIFEGGVLGPDVNDILVSNAGAKAIHLKAGRVLLRCPKSVFGSMAQVSAIECMSNESLNFDQINVEGVDEASRQALIGVLQENADGFSKGELDLGLTHLGEMKIQLTTEKPVYYRPYRLSVSDRAVVRAKVEQLLANGVIRESNSEYASPVLLVPKKNGETRLCVDYRALNKITVKDRYPLPLIDDQLDKLAGKNYFTTLDLAQGYHQVPMHPDSIAKTAFITPDAQFEYLRVPFGVANGPSVFQRVVNKMLGGLQHEKILVYMDDLLIPSETTTGGIELLAEVLALVRQAGLKLNLAKCSFLKTKLEYLGHEICAGGIQPGARKIQAVTDFMAPKNVHGVRQFLGLASYFRRYVENFAGVARPLTNLTKKDAPWRWDPEQEQAFQTLKVKLTSRPVLALYSGKAETEIHTDASRWGVAGILLQKQSNGDLQPVMYFSRTTNVHEQVYHSYELETLAVVETIRRFRVYLVGIHFKVVTDCSAVRATMAKRDLVPRVARWWMELQGYDMEIEYRPGVKMQHVDALSRNPSANIGVINMAEGDWFLTVQLQDDKAQKILALLAEGTAGKDLKANYRMAGGRLYRRTKAGDRLYVPAMARFNLLRMYHDDIGHPGVGRCRDLLQKEYWFPKMRRFIDKYVTACLRCAFGKGDYGRAKGLLHPIEKVAIPFDTIHIDHLGPFSKSRRGNAYLLMIVDGFTKFTLAKATKTVGSAEAIQKLREVFGEYGYPRRIISDRGLAFTSKAFKSLLAEKGVKHVLNAIATPRANGQVERQNRTILNALATSTDDEIGWDEKLPEIIWGMNHAVSASTGTSPAELMFTNTTGAMADLSQGVRLANATTASETFEAAKEQVIKRRKRAKQILDRAGEAMRTQYNKRRKVATTYQKGDLVLWRNAGTLAGEKGVNRKLLNKYDGPYRVGKALGNDRYRISTVKGIRGYKKFTAIVAEDSLRRYKSSASGETGVVGEDTNAGETGTEGDGDLGDVPGEEGVPPEIA